jgi:hypothetical protein
MLTPETSLYIRDGQLFLCRDWMGYVIAGWRTFLEIFFNSVIDHVLI